MLQSLKAGAQLQEKNSQHHSLPTPVLKPGIYKRCWTKPRDPVARKWLWEALTSWFGHLWETWIQIFALYFRISWFWTTTFFWNAWVQPHVGQGLAATVCPTSKARTRATVRPWGSPSPRLQSPPWKDWTQFGASHGRAWTLTLLWCCSGRGWQPWEAEVWSWPVAGWG